MPLAQCHSAIERRYASYSAYGARANTKNAYVCGAASVLRKPSRASSAAPIGMKATIATGFASNAAAASDAAVQKRFPKRASSSTIQRALAKTAAVTKNVIAVSGVYVRP